jgi:hypothetical protein
MNIESLLRDAGINCHYLATALFARYLNLKLGCRAVMDGRAVVATLRFSSPAFVRTLPHLFIKFDYTR